MTCVVGMVRKNTVYIGADSAGTSSDFSTTDRIDKKVFVNGEFVIGFCGSFRMGQLLQYNLRVPKKKPQQDVMKYMVTVFIEAVRNCFRRGGFTITQNGQEEGGLFLVGYQGRLFRIDSDFQVGESMDQFEAIGCGESFALAAVYNLKNDPEPRKIVLRALRTAEKFSAGVRGPFHIEQIPGLPKRNQR